MQAEAIMDKVLLETQKILQGYDAVSTLYPFVPPITFWRAWEYAAYRRYKLPEPVLDVGCGDGRYFNLVWPNLKHVSGIDIEEGVILDAQKTGVYEQLLVTPASDLKFPDAHFASVFANCALEHMDDIDKVLSEIARVLQPDGLFLFSVVTEKNIDWTTLPLFINEINGKAKADSSIQDYIEYHHLRNPFRFEEWVRRITTAGFECLEYIPILPENTGKFFLFMDQLWHVKASNGSEIGQSITNHLEKFQNFPNAMRRILEGFVEMENDWSHGCGVVFLAKKAGTNTLREKNWLQENENLDHESSMSQADLLRNQLEQLRDERDQIKDQKEQIEKALLEAQIEIEELKHQKPSDASFVSKVFKEIGLLRR
jgi:ubiquinone/menaquinone biosynthesis C-methylase UbiE